MKKARYERALCPMLYSEAFFPLENQEKKGSRFALARLIIRCPVVSLYPPPPASISYVCRRGTRTPCR